MRNSTFKIDNATFTKVAPNNTFEKSVANKMQEITKTMIRIIPRPDNYR